jgi:type I restriction-modification system DNA methylase subunit
MSATIQKEINKQKQRGKKRVKQTGEVFTPMDLCLQMVKEIPEAKLKDANAKFLDNSCGDGNFLVTLLEVLSEYHDPKHVINEMIYGVDLMEDNVATAKERLGLTEGDKGWHHIVCANGLEYDYTFEAGHSPSTTPQISI